MRVLYTFLCMFVIPIASFGLLLPNRFEIRSDNGFFLYDPADQQKKIESNRTVLVLEKRGDDVFINDKKYIRKRLAVIPRQGYMVVGEKKQKTPFVIDCTQPFAHHTKKSHGDAPEHIATQGRYKKPFYNVRVLLAEGAVHDKAEFTVTANNDCVIFNPHDHQKKIQKVGKTVVVKADGSSLYVNGKKYHSHKVMVRSPMHCIHFQDKLYQGVMLFVLHGGSLYVINCLDLEEYVCAVLRTESWPGWPLEVNKVFAIMCRTYAIATIEQSRRAKKLYDIINTNKHQTYSGYHTSADLKQAVQETKGVFLAYHHKPIMAMFDSCCGGIVPAQVEGVVAFDHAPYLARNYPCIYCKQCKIYQWEKEYPIDQFITILQNAGYPVDTLKSIKIKKRDKAGLTQEVVITTKKGASYLLQGKTVYSLLKEVKSFCFSMKKRGNSILVQGKGYGHHIGLCQWGAREMVRDHWDHRRILQFYYPRTTFMQLG